MFLIKYEKYILYSFVIRARTVSNKKFKNTFERHAIDKILKYIIIYYIYKLYNIKHDQALIGLINILLLYFKLLSLSNKC